MLQGCFDLGPGPGRVTYLSPSRNGRDQNNRVIFFLSYTYLRKNISGKNKKS